MGRWVNGGGAGGAAAVTHGNHQRAEGVTASEDEPVPGIGGIRNFSQEVLWDISARVRKRWEGGERRAGEGERESRAREGWREELLGVLLKRFTFCKGRSQDATPHICELN